MIHHSQNKILLLGTNSFAATGLAVKLEKEGFNVDQFLRGDAHREGKVVLGDVFSLSTNKYLNDQYDTVINFIIIKDSNVKENLKFVEELVNCCEAKNVKNLIQISSISVYPNSAKFINEESPIEKSHEYKGTYASVKVAVDNYLVSKSNSNMYISFVRPGFILSKDRIPTMAGIMKKLPFGIGLLLGNKETVLPTINRELFQNAVVNILKLKLSESVYLILNNNTKYALVKNQFKYKVIMLPMKFTLFLAKILFLIKVFNKKQYLQVLGLFKTTYFDAGKSEKILKLKFQE